jgi:molybdate transport system substrate-binding protein
MGKTLRQRSTVVCAATLILIAQTLTLVAQGAKHTELRIFAASSLVDVLNTLTREYARHHPSVTISINSAGSQQLLQQIVHGAPFDLFVSAGPRQMREAIIAGEIDSASVRMIAENRLAVITPSDDHHLVRMLNDLGKPGVRLVVADTAVPAGEYSEEMIVKCDRSGSCGSGFAAAVHGNIVSFEENVRAVLAKVSLGEADAGIVYSSDVIGHSTVTMIDIPESLNIVAHYPAALAARSKHREEARAFLEFAVSPEGRDVFRSFGFLGTSSRQPAR